MRRLEQTKDARRPIPSQQRVTRLQPRTGVRPATVARVDPFVPRIPCSPKDAAIVGAERTGRGRRQLARCRFENTTHVEEFPRQDTVVERPPINMRHPVGADLHPMLDELPDIARIEVARATEALADDEEGGGQTACNELGQHDFGIRCITVVKCQRDVGPSGYDIQNRSQITLTDPEMLFTRVDLRVRPSDPVEGEVEAIHSHEARIRGSRRRAGYHNDMSL